MLLEAHISLSLQMINEHRLRKVVSDISVEIEKYKKELETIVVVVEAECECCGLKEECTPAYIGQVEECYSGNWVCGLCCEAVKERLARAPEIAMGEAVGSHREFCQKFNATTRLNPKLSLTCTMRDIAKRSCENRESSNSSITKLVRTTSCFPDINYELIHAC
jgi:hypothetical protein